MRDRFSGERSDTGVFPAVHPAFLAFFFIFSNVFSSYILDSDGKLLALYKKIVAGENEKKGKVNVVVVA